MGMEREIDDHQEKEKEVSVVWRLVEAGCRLYLLLSPS